MEALQNLEITYENIQKGKYGLHQILIRLNKC